MKLFFDESGSLEAFKKLLSEAEAETDINGILVFAADANGFTNDELDPFLQTLNRPVLGGVFPTVIYRSENYEKGTLVVGLNRLREVAVVTDLSDSSADYMEVLEDKFPEDIELSPTTLVFLDGFSGRIATLIDDLFNVFGLETNYIGGGAGSLSMQQKPCVITNEGLLQDAAVVGLLDMQSGLGVNHGWTSVQGPFQVTESENTTIKTLDHRPAFEVYREVVEKHSGQVFTDSNFFDIAKAYPFGISKVGAERVVRDPIMADGQNLVCVGEVKQGSYVDILNGNQESLLKAAEEAKNKSEQNMQTDTEARLFIDCISRVLFLGENFRDELQIVSSPDVPLIGACTLGEIANNQNIYLEFYNKTAVIINLGK